MRKILPVLYVFALILGLASCGAKANGREAAQKLENRYGEKFTVLEVYPTQIGAGYFEVKVCPTNQPHIIFEAAFDTRDENFSDEYVACLKSHELANLLREILPDGCFVHGEVCNPKPICTDKMVSLDEYMSSDPVPWVRLAIFAENIDGLSNVVREFFDQYPNWELRGTVYQVEDLQSIQNYFKAEPTLGFDLKMELGLNGTEIA